MVPELPWTISKVPESDLDQANDLGSDGWQPFAVSNGFIYLRRMGTTLDRIKIPVNCGTCKYFASAGKHKDNDIEFGFCKLNKHSTNENHYCDKFEPIYE